MTAAIFVILFINFMLHLNLMESQQFDTFDVKIEQMIHTLENNQIELNLFYEALQENVVVLSDSRVKVISASCGFVLTDNAKSSIDELLSHADEALYEAKQGTKGKYIEYQQPPG